jgi:hypothetical protein
MIGCEVTRSIGCLTLLAVAFHLSGSFVPDSPLSETPEKHAKKKKGTLKLKAGFTIITSLPKIFAMAFCQGISFLEQRQCITRTMFVTLIWEISI